ncbi:hypothetical protein SNEBB_010242 [Seison nebaliae]|nr:hypothetical protein SNEBB_010242 [Seison nebaliae]
MEKLKIIFHENHLDDDRLMGEIVALIIENHSSEHFSKSLEKFKVISQKKKLFDQILQLFYEENNQFVVDFTSQLHLDMSNDSFDKIQKPKVTHKFHLLNSEKEQTTKLFSFVDEKLLQKLLLTITQISIELDGK